MAVDFEKKKKKTGKMGEMRPKRHLMARVLAKISVQRVVAS